MLPRIKNRFKLVSIVHYNILTAGIGESFLAEMIAPVEDSLPSHIKLAYLPKLGQVRLRLSAYGDNEEKLREEVMLFASRIAGLAGEYIVTTEDVPLEKAIMDFMEARQLTLSLAESCTGGYLAHLLTQHPGSSASFLGGAVSYSNVLKERMLNVSAATLASYGAVSEQTVREMARGALNNFGTDYAIAVSGVAGPGGGSVEKPVGTVWVAVSSKQKELVQKFSFGNRRTQNIERAAVNALILLFKLLKEENIKAGEKN